MLNSLSIEDHTKYRFPQKKHVEMKKKEHFL